MAAMVDLVQGFGFVVLLQRGRHGSPPPSLLGLLLLQHHTWDPIFSDGTQICRGEWQIQRGSGERWQPPVDGLGGPIHGIFLFLFFYIDCLCINHDLLLEAVAYARLQ
jgi:hypothetical protein